MRKGIGIAGGVAIGVGSVVYLAFAGWLSLKAEFFPSPIPVPGWTCTAKGGTCTPDGGNWDGLRVGMGHTEALQAACGLLTSGVIRPGRNEDLAGASTPVFMTGQTCKPDPYELKRKPVSDDEPITDPSGTLASWILYPTDMWCTRHVHKQHVWVDFDKHLRVKAIYATCEQVIY